MITPREMQAWATEQQAEIELRIPAYLSSPRIAGDLTKLNGGHPMDEAMRYHYIFGMIASMGGYSIEETLAIVVLLRPSISEQSFDYIRRGWYYGAALRRTNPPAADSQGEHDGSHD